MINSRYRWLWEQLRGGPLHHAAASVSATFLASCCAAIDPYILRIFIDHAVYSKGLNTIFAMAGAFFLVYTLRVSSSSAAGVYAFQAGQQFATRTRRTLLQSVSGWPGEIAEKFSASELQFRIENDVSQIADGGAECMLVIARTVIGTSVILTAMAALTHGLTAIVIALIPVFLLVRAKYYHTLRECSQRVQDGVARRAGFVYEHVGGLEQIQLLQMEELRRLEFAQATREVMRCESDRRVREALFGTASVIIIILAIGVLIVLGGVRLAHGMLTIGTFVALYSYIIRLFEPLGAVVDLGTKIQRMQVSLSRAYEIVTAYQVKPTHAHIQQRTIKPAAIEFRSVCFTYGRDCTILKGTSFQIGPGEFVGLIGPNGAGKSTIAKLLVRLYSAQTGVILIDGVSIEAVDLADLRTSIGLVPQDPFLFAGTIRENLLRSSPDAKRTDVLSVCEIASLDEVITRLPNGLDEQIGSRGNRLSGGERQRVALARALLRRPSLLILDESTSALDLHTEAHVLSRLRGMKGTLSVLLISHRPSAISVAERVLCVDNGRVREAGSPATILSTSECCSPGKRA